MNLTFGKAQIMDSLAEGIAAVMRGEKTFDDLLEETAPEFPEMKIIETAQAGTRRDLALRILRLEKQVEELSTVRERAENG